MDTYINTTLLYTVTRDEVKRSHLSLSIYPSIYCVDWQIDRQIERCMDICLPNLTFSCRPRCHHPQGLRDR